MTDEALERIAWYAAQASPPPVCVIQVPDEADPVSWVMDALYATVGEASYGVALGSPDVVAGGAAVLTAFTGNGTDSLANANFYMLCHTAVPLLIAEIRRLWATVAASHTQEDTP